MDTSVRLRGPVFLSASVLIAIVFCFLLAPPAGAAPQTQTGTVHGRVTDLSDAPLPGIAVTAAGDALPFERRTVTDVNGRYRFVRLPPGTYALTFAIGGQSLQRRVEVTIGNGIVVDVSMALFQFAVEVTGEQILEVDLPSPLIDLLGTWVGSNFDEQMLQEVPSARDVWSVVANQAPAAVTDTFNVGGSESGLQPYFAARGASWTQSNLSADGVKFTDPDATGTAGFYYDFDAIAEMQVSTSSHAVETQTPGVYLNLVTRSGSNDYHGSGDFYWTDGSWQSDNISDEQADLGVTRGNSVDKIADAGVQFGGPLVRDRLTFFTSYRYFTIDRVVLDFPEIESTTFPSWLFKANWQIDPDNRVWGSYTTQSYEVPNRGASALVSPEATHVEDDRTSIFQANWQSTLSAEALLEVRFSALTIDFPLQYRDDVSGQSISDFVTLRTTRAAPFSSRFDRRRRSVHALLSYFVPDWGGSHDFRFGFQFDNSAVDSDFAVIDDVNLATFGGGPAFVARFNTPLAVQNDVNVTSFFADDSWSFGDFTLGLGVRADLTNGWLPAQESPAGSFAPARSFERVDDVVSWRALVPRLQAIWDVLGDGSLAVKGSYSAYSDQMSASTVSFANPNARSFEVYAWVDFNGDLEYQLGEEVFLLAPGGSLVSSIDPGFNTSFTNELTVGVDHEFADDWVVGATFIYRHQDNIQEDVNIGLSADDFVPVEIDDPAGGTITVFNQVSGFGNDFFELTNVEEKEVTYKGLDLTVQRRFRESWQLFAGLTIGDASQLGGKSGFVPGDPGPVSDLFNSPNAQINARGKSPWDRPYILKVSGNYTAPYGILLGGVLRSQSGAPLARIVPVELNQGVVEIFADPRGFDRLPTLTTIDLRLGKEFLLPRGSNVSVHLDVFNLTNASATIQAVESEPLFGTPLMTLAPRTIRLGARVAF